MRARTLLFPTKEGVALSDSKRWSLMWTIKAAPRGRNVTRKWFLFGEENATAAL